MRTPTKTLIEALKILAQDIQSEDGVANAAIYEAANRMQELYDALCDRVIYVNEEISKGCFIKGYTLETNYDTMYRDIHYRNCPVFGDQETAVEQNLLNYESNK